MPTSIAVVPAIEASAVMTQSGFASAASINAQAFVDDLLQGDALGVVSFNEVGIQSYAPGGKLAVVDATLSQLTAADAAIAALSYTSPSVNIGGSLQTAYSLLGNPPAGAATGVLLLSSGQQNTGTDPTTLGSYLPTWVCALGPSANIALLQQISVLSRGQYLYVPTPNDISTAINQIRGQQPGWQTLLNQSKSVAAQGFWLQPVTLTAGLAQAQFSVIWENANLTYTSSSNPGPNEISVTLVQPPGITLKTPPSAMGGGYCVFNVPTPVSGPGQWYVQVMYPGLTPLPMAIGVFGRSTNARVELQVTPTASPQAGAPLEVRVRASQEGDAVHIISASIEVTEPRVSLTHLLRAHDLQGENQLSQLQARRLALLPRGDIFQHTRRQAVLQATGDNVLKAQITTAAVAGSLNAKVSLRGRYASSGAEFERSELISLVVPD